MSEDKMREHFERLWRFDMSEGFSGMSSPKVEQLKATCRAGFDEGVKACAAIKDAEIAELNNRLRIEENAHAELQSRCFDQGGTFSNVFDELKQCKAEIAARDLMLKELRDVLDSANTALYYGECSINERNPEIDSKNERIARMMERMQDRIREALANSERHNSRALEKMLLESELKGLTTIEFDRYLRHGSILAKLAELNKE